MSVAKL